MKNTNINFINIMKYYQEKLYLIVYPYLVIVVTKLSAITL